MLNWAGMAFKMAETDFNLGADIMNITSKYLSSKARQISLEAQRRNYRRQADSAMKSAGFVQKNAEQMAEMRLVQLGQDKGRIDAQAAGSGMDVSSRSVVKTASDTARSAWNDVSVINMNAQNQAQGAVNQWLSSKSAEIGAKFAVRQEKQNRKWQLWGGILSAIADWHGGMAEAGNKLMGGGGNNIGMAGSVGGFGMGG